MSGSFFEKCCKKKKYKSIGDNEFGVEDDRPAPSKVGLIIKSATTLLSYITYALYIARTTTDSSQAASILNTIEKVTGGLMMLGSGSSTILDCIGGRELAKDVAKTATSNITLALAITWVILYVVEEADVSSSYGLTVAQFALGGVEVASSTLSTAFEYCFG